jgi:hypothetical protein
MGPSWLTASTHNTVCYPGNTIFSQRMIRRKKGWVGTIKIPIIFNKERAKTLKKIKHNVDKKPKCHLLFKARGTKEQKNVKKKTKKKMFKPNNVINHFLTL